MLKSRPQVVREKRAGTLVISKIMISRAREHRFLKKVSFRVDESTPFWESSTVGKVRSYKPQGVFLRKM
jgi:hypothetical protein